MTMQHGTQPTDKPAKSKPDAHKDRKRGVKNVLPPRDGTTRTEGVSKQHRLEDQKDAKEKS